MLVSVCVPCYNVSHYLSALVLSLIRQTYKEWELVLVDDGSEDETVKVACEIMRTHPLHSIGLGVMKHGGCAAALKCAIELSHGEVCTFVGGDDMLEPHSLGALVCEFEKRLKLGFLWSRWRHTGNYKCWTKPLPPRKTLKEALLSGWWGAQCQQMFRRDLYLSSPGLDPKIPLATDLQLAALFSELPCEVLYLPNVTYVYRAHPKQSSHVMRSLQSMSAKKVLAKLSVGEYRRGVA